MAFSDVRDNVQFSGFNPTDQSALLAALEYLYTNSSSAKDTLDIINSDFKLSITYEANNASAIPNGYQVYFDVSYVSAIKYYDKNGNLRSFTTADLLMHEVIHAIEGTGDVKYDSLLDSPTADFYGPTVTMTRPRF